MAETCDSNEITKPLLENLLVKQRLTLAEAGKRLNRSAVTVLRHAQRFRIEGRRQQRAQHRREEIYELKLSGMKTTEIAKRIGCAVRTVQTVVKDYERHLINEDLGLAKDACFTRQQWGHGTQAEDEEVFDVKPWRCPRHGLVRTNRCLICAAEQARDGV